MSQLDNRRVDTAPAAQPNSQDGTGPSPMRVFVIGAIVIIAIVAVVLVLIQTFLFPVWEANSEGARQVATAEAQLSAASTREAIAPRAAATVAPTATLQPPVALTVPSTPAAVSAPEPTAATTAIPALQATPTAAPDGTPAPLPTVSPEQAAEIAAAYENYFHVTSDALLNLDPTLLSEVTDGQELAGLQRDIEQDRAQGRALQTNVQHDFYVLDVQGDQADVADRYKDSSIYVDPVTHAPLPGQVAPESPDVAPAVSVIYHLQRMDGTWKVVSGQRFVPQGRQ